MDHSRFNIITPCINRKNLSYLYNSIICSQKSFPVEWFIIYNSHNEIVSEEFNQIDWIHQYCFYTQNGIQGFPQMNFALDLISFGYVYQLNDNNVIHPLFFETLERYIQKFNKQGYIFYQTLPNNLIRKNGPTNITEYCIDKAQFLLRRDLIGNLRYRNSQIGDGKLIESLFNNNKSVFTFITKELCYYNYLDFHQEI